MSALRIQNYIIREVSVPFALGIALFTFVLLLSRMLKLIELIVNKGVPATQIFGIFAALMPSFFVITVPLSFLLATIIAFSRLSADSEVVAMKAAGFSVYQLAKPVIVLALFVCLFTGWLTLYAEPVGRASLRQQLIDIAFSRAAIAIIPQVFNEEIPGLMLYANEVDPKSGALDKVFISDNRLGKNPAVINAHQGRIYSNSTDGKLLLHLTQGTIHRRQQHLNGETYQVVHFSDYDINLSVKDNDSTSAKQTKKPYEMSTNELIKKINSGDNKKKIDYQVELNERLILPLSPLIFALLAIPLGIRSQRSNRSGGFAWALIVFLVYYLLFSISKTMVVDNGWPAILSMWSPTVIFFIVSGYILHYTAQERPLPGSNLWSQLTTNISHYWRRKR